MPRQRMKTGGEMNISNDIAELVVLGAMLLDLEVVPIVARLLPPEDFSSDANGKIYAALLRIYEKHSTVDLFLLEAELRARGILEECGGLQKICHLIDPVPTSANGEYYARIVLSASLRRSDMIAKILSRLDLAKGVGEYTTLTRRGGRWWGCCPFHQEKTPSFSVTPEKGVFYCFGCHKGGGLFQFVMEAEKVPFRDAVELLAKKAGGELPREEEAPGGIRRGNFTV